MEYPQRSIMSLRRKLIIKDSLILLSLIAVVGACLGGLLRQRSHVQASLDEYAAVRLVESATAHVVSANAQLDGKQVDSQNYPMNFTRRRPTSAATSRCFRNTKR
jgi:hypothetical protein